MPDPIKPDPAEIQKNLNIDRFRVRAFANKLQAETAALRQIEAAAARRKREEFVTEATPVVEAMMGALRMLVDRVTEVRELCERHSMPFGQLPFDLSAPPGCGGYVRPDPHPFQRLQALNDLPYLFSEVAGIRKHWSAEDEQVRVREAKRHEAEEADRRKREAAEEDARRHRLMLNPATGKLTRREIEAAEVATFK